MEEQPKSPPRRRWRKWLLWTLFVVFLLVYGLGQFLYYFVKSMPETHPIEYASAIAAGVLRPEFGYSSYEYKYPKLEEPTCDTRFNNDDTYEICARLANRNSYRGCAWWRFENCLSLEAEEYSWRTRGKNGRNTTSTTSTASISPTRPSRRPG
tara:strand:- start:149 stop:607 length:459 start_codon:yes stop_codon:yes gene_type:complete